MRTFKHLDYGKRQQIERMLKNNYKVRDIATCLQVALSTIYNEIKRGTYEKLNSNLSTSKVYSAELAQEKYKKNLKDKGKYPKILYDDKLAKYIKYMLKNQKFSPEAIIYEIQNNQLEFDVDIKSRNTIYSAIRRGYISEVKTKDLPRGGKYKKYVKADRTHKRNIKGVSIEKRPEQISAREEFGHWEMDSVIGKKTNSTTLLVLTERKTRHEIIEKMKAHTANEVRKALNRIEKRYKSGFYEIFKTITVDNGAEFQDFKSIEKALYRVGNRTQVYYCHPNSPHERGSNENCNELIRRWFPKGSDFDTTVTASKVKEVETWVNLYPRKIHKGQCAESLFVKELCKLNVQHYYLC